MENLQAHIIGLEGSHLIEASAGTGKTFNITRLYLRMLLERQLSVENILVMTFTKAATEEIRGRIDHFLRDALANWDRYTTDAEDDYFYALGKRVDKSFAQVAIKHALINLDLAAIYTIHGFCSRVLSEQAFASGLSFSAQMETDDSGLYLQAVQDAYRVLAKQSQTEFELLTQFWPEPENYIKEFLPLLRAETLPSIETIAHFTLNLVRLAQQAKHQLLTHEAFIDQHLISSKKGKELAKRQNEWQDLLLFLDSLMALPVDENSDMTLTASNKQQLIEQLQYCLEQSVDFKFVSSSRWPKAADKKDIKAQLQDIFQTPLKIEKIIKSFGTALPKVEAFEVLLISIKMIKNSVLKQKEQLQLLSFDDLIEQLQKALLAERNAVAKPLTELLRQQYPVALIDEFQDTDARQFSIVQDLYLTQQNVEQYALYLIGDPKQAIYGFRGGDIFTYLDAANQVSKRWVMDTNWRSSEQMISGYNHLFYGGQLDKPYQNVFGFDIDYQPVKASVLATKQCLQDPHSDYQALQFVEFTDTDEYMRSGFVTGDFRPQISAWCANEIKRLLLNAHIRAEQGEQPIKAADVAVLVRDSIEASEIQQALNDLGIASVYKSQRDNLFNSDVARQFITVLDAVIHYQDDRRFISALATQYFAFHAKQIADLQHDENRYEEVKSWFSQLHRMWSQRGFMAMGLKLLHDYLPKNSGVNERQLTNMIHLLELLQLAWQRMRLPQQLLSYLIEQCHNPLSEVAELRLESDANLVQIVTQHGSKGLEYPIVFVPFSSRHKDPTKQGTSLKQVLKYYDQQSGIRWHVGNDERIRQQMANESYAEDIRLLYVAITRAKHRCYMPLVQFSDYHLSPVGQTLKLQKNQDFASALSKFELNAQSGIDYCLQAGIVPVEGKITQAIEEQLSVPVFAGRIERDWWLSSFSALTRNMRHSGRANSERDETEIAQASRQQGLSHLRFSFPKGANTGNLLHDILEYSDFTQPNWPLVASPRLSKIVNLPNEYSEPAFFDWMDDVLATPIDRQQTSLSSLAATQTLKEAEFYFPMETVDTQSLQWLVNHFRQDYLVTVSANTTTTLASIKKPFALSSSKDLQGMMHGFIDLIFTKQDSPDREPQFYVCDYKSSHLGNTMADYHPEKLSLHISQHNYDLQFLIYALALHRYLQERIADYQFKQHFGGVFYLYLRGMSRANTERQGVFFNPLSEQLIESLDRVFKGESLSDADKTRLQAVTKQQQQPEQIDADANRNTGSTQQSDAANTQQLNLFDLDS
ncbi:exodeoxyribonuclease V subunit beta [Thalassotalea sp. Y01]|uniref:exodeoxyribonuclease V subunit beta n=1 Tax=Thalassotalea sp. Y01 TaxID=2729613 RepID=UPI00145C4590|nr:exodeoxyribonuclease V subunit beta [Thalassotalea sp. Y01]